MTSATERRLAVSCATALVLLRSVPFVFGDSPPFDADQAIFGLMAKHMSELRAFSAFPYGQSYILAVDAWLAAPLFYLAGPSVTALKLPILAINLTVTLLLMRSLDRELGLRPLVALVPALFFILPPIPTADLLLQACGGNAAPFLYVLLLWLLRRRPLIFGAVLAFGFVNREFTAYGLGALLLIEATNGPRAIRQSLQDKLLAGVSASAVFSLVRVLGSVGNPAGPGTTAASVVYPDQLQVFMGTSCWTIAGIPTWLTRMFGTHLEHLYSGGARWLWLTLGLTALGCLARLVFLAYHGIAGRRHGWQFPAYISLVGLLAALVPAVARCGFIHARYVLLALFLLAGITALYLRMERNTRLRAVVISVVLLWASVNAVDHMRHAAARHASPPDPREVLIDHLLANDIRFAVSDYWTAYHVTFLSEEEVIIASSDFVRIHQYQDVLRSHDDAVRIGLAPCDGGQEVAGFHVCPPPAGQAR